MSENDPAVAPAGWYPDPEMAETLRYWDGSAWTEHRTPATPTQPAAAKKSGPKAIVCQFCHTAGGVTVRRERRAKRKTATRIGFGVLTLGGSIPATGVSKKGTVTVLSCSNCGMAWDAPKAQP